MSILILFYLLSSRTKLMFQSFIFILNTAQLQPELGVLRLSLLPQLEYLMCFSIESRKLNIYLQQIVINNSELQTMKITNQIN